MSKEVKKKPPAHEVIVEKFISIVTQVIEFHKRSCGPEAFDSSYCAMEALLDVLSKMHIPTNEIHSVKDRIRTAFHEIPMPCGHANFDFMRGRFYKYLENFSE